MARSTAIGAPALTLEAWGELSEDEPGELVDGCLQEEEVPTRVHEAAVAWLLYALTRWGRPRGARTYGSELKLAVSPARGRKPDLNLFLAGTARSPGRAKLQRHPPDVVIEVISPSPADARRDRVEKPDDYAAFGVRFYWIVDPELRTIEILERGEDGRYVRALAASTATVTPPGLEGLALDLDALWAELDEELATGE